MRRRTAAIVGEDGFTVIEVLVAALILAVGVAATLVTLGSSGRLNLVAERHTELVHTAQNELERVLSLPYSQVALTGTSGAWSSTPGDYTYVSTPSGACPSSPSGAPPTYQPDHSPSGASTSTEPLIIDGCTYTMTVNGTQTTTTPSSGTIVPVTAWSAPLQSGSTVSGYIFDFVTWSADPSCSQTPTPGSNCDTSKDYKRVTVVVTMNGATEPAHPMIVSGFVTPPNTGKNPLSGSGTTCTNSQGQTVSCTNNPPPNQSPLQYFFCDSSYTNGSCTEPISCAGNNLHNTLETVGASAPAPDLLGTTAPSGSCTSGTPPVATPPCFGLDLGCGSGAGLPLPSCSTNCTATCTPSCQVNPGTAPCYAPPTSNSQSHSWVTPAIPAGVTWNLTGTGNVTVYLESSSASTIQATLCVGLYVVPAGVLGSLTGNLLGTQVGAVASANVQAPARVPTPVTFNFSAGIAPATYAVVSTGQARIELVLWFVGSSTPIDVVYDQAGYAGQATLYTAS